jgi:hypothetical protein
MKLVIGFHYSGGDRRSVLYQFARNQATPCYLLLNLAPSSLFRAGLSPAWTRIAKGLTSIDLRAGEKLAEKTGVLRKNIL